MNVYHIKEYSNKDVTMKLVPVNKRSEDCNGDTTIGDYTIIIEDPKKYGTIRRFCSARTMTLMKYPKLFSKEEAFAALCLANMNIRLKTPNFTEEDRRKKDILRMNIFYADNEFRLTKKRSINIDPSWKEVETSYGNGFRSVVFPPEHSLRHLRAHGDMDILGDPKGCLIDIIKYPS